MKQKQIRPGSLVHPVLRISWCSKAEKFLKQTWIKLTEVPGADSFSLASPFAGQARGSVSEHDQIFQFFPSYNGNTSDCSCKALVRVQGGKRAKDSFSYDQKLLSAHKQLHEQRPGDKSNSKETNATITETSPGKSYCSGCLKLGQTEQWWQQHNRKWMAEALP